MESKVSHQYALITGASAGIGKAFAKLLAAKGYNLILVARRGDKLEQIAESLKNQYGTLSEVIEADLASPSSAQDIMSTLEQREIPVHFLVNNAGFSINTAFTQADWSEHVKNLQVMLISLTQLCHLVAPQMKQRGFGHIINLSSLAAVSPPMAGSLYTAIKSYVKDFSISLDLELKHHNINCTALCPGMTHSEFHEVMDIVDKVDEYPPFMWMTPDAVAQQGYDAVIKGKPVLINGWINKFIAFLSAITPNKILFKMTPPLIDL